jgi:twin arginine-targeting protein translocase TatB|tara:strand:- start:125 stop:382 length:258 start_codon:yes stop_codon:yes gene_type:complete
VFDIGFWELITIAILALIIVRPEKLPKFAKDAGKLLKNLRNYVKKTKKEMAKELNVEEISELQDSINHVDKLMEEAPDKNLSDKK